ncbi:hypothetical protein N7472_001653 [Penicillium cf. griseofulvum]|uniref:Uncharacterized protein n=1 Tax=Penicillium cf. griseofulvum TaxID=2972120 RepID=A0A9W9T184_9EURO|nr:hypothetical protein N7472_001653 [Penicillium cf. griseofulvum]
MYERGSPSLGFILANIFNFFVGGSLTWGSIAPVNIDLPDIAANPDMGASPSKEISGAHLGGRIACAQGIPRSGNRTGQPHSSAIINFGPAAGPVEAELGFALHARVALATGVYRQWSAFSGAVPRCALLWNVALFVIFQIPRFASSIVTGPRRTHPVNITLITDLQIIPTAFPIPAESRVAFHAILARRPELPPLTNSIHTEAKTFSILSAGCPVRLWWRAQPIRSPAEFKMRAARGTFSMAGIIFAYSGPIGSELAIFTTPFIGVIVPVPASILRQKHVLI